MSDYQEVYIEKLDLEKEIISELNTYSARVEEVEIFSDVEEDLAEIFRKGSPTSKRINITTENISEFYKRVILLGDSYSRIKALHNLYNKYFKYNPSEEIDLEELEKIVENARIYQEVSTEKLLKRLRSNMTLSLTHLFIDKPKDYSTLDMP